ncbi:MAG: bifunctional 4-hydroxy-2-oxoglutarate aldolase/2-dehydro-3-deoxy-phosphogluconate aldolase [Candidatus Marinimicrobia bacterium]|nr:bifunctional 4-hydroxy-2-oxoglutarate aldolase/2-dehydro-3-deoxy-phosphogluconate aldolase [Candidatus Neomarinimicrobiota bacterium]
MKSSKKDILKKFKKYRISAIIRTNHIQIASDAMKAAVSGGFKIIEFTLNTPGSLELIRSFSLRHNDLLVGAGTVLTLKELKNSIDAGAQFIVSPICDPELIALANDMNVVCIPGTYTATEMEEAYRLGADFVKLFPAPANIEQYVKALLGPLPHLKIFPTAGVNLDNMLDILRAGASGLGFTDSLFKGEDLTNRNYNVIELRAKKIINRLSTL